MKIAIIGAGAMGCLFGGKLAAAADVCLYDVNQQQVDAINQHGLIMTCGDQETVVRMRATAQAKKIGPVDACLFFTKYRFMDQAARDALECVGPETVVLTLQNGLGCADLLKKYFPEHQIAYGLTAYTSDLKGPGHIEMTTTSSVGTYFWPMDNCVRPPLKLLETTMTQAGFEVEITRQVNERIWRKLMVNCAENTLCAILRITVGQVVDTPECYELLKQVVFEISDVAAAKGIWISREEGLRYVEQVSSSVREHLPSMGLDVKLHRPTEIMCLNEAVVAEGRRLGVATPMLDTLAKMIRTIEANYDHLAF